MISSSKDGLLKFWDVEQQSCILNSSDQYLSKIEDFCLIPELKLLLAGSSDNQLKVFKLSQNKDTGSLECNIASIIKKDSGSRVLELVYDTLSQNVVVLSSDNKLEVIKVNIDNKESILKKLLRAEKRKALKRLRSEAVEGSEEEEAKPKVQLDKEAIALLVETGKYDIGLHFSKKLSFEVDKKSKVKSFQMIPSKSKTARH